MNTQATEAPLPGEPAIPSYFFGKGYRDLWNTIAESWYRNTESAKEQFETASGTELFPAAFHGAAGFAIFIFGAVFFLVASALHISLLFIFFLIIYLGFSLAFFSDWLFRTINRFFTVCPDCHHKSALPDFACPCCRRWHGRLFPNKFGIFYHTCLCGEKLPCVFFLGRSRLESRCAACNTTLDAIYTNSRKAFIPVLGGVAVGKTVFLTMALYVYRKSLAAKGAEVKFHDGMDEIEFQATVARLTQGRLPDKTISPHPRAKALELRLPQDGATRLLYFYDPAGEALQDSELLATHRYLEYLSGILLLVDPFVFPEIKSCFGNPEDDNLDQALPTEVFARLLSNMHEHFGLASKDKIQVPVAVVFTKIDMLPGDTQCRPPSVLMHPAAEGYAEAFADYSNQVRSLLLDVGLNWVIQDLETHCANIAYFACSALGRKAGTGEQAYQGWGCFEPIAWVLSRRNKDYLPTENGKG